MYKCGYLDLICEIKHLMEVIIHTLFYLYRIYPPNSFQKHKRFGIIVRCQEKQEVIHYVQRLVETLYLLLKDRVLHTCSIVLKGKHSGETVASYNIQVEQWLYKTPILHFDILDLREKFSRALLNLETRTTSPEEPCEFSVYFHTRAKIKGAMVKGVYPRVRDLPIAQVCAPPILKLEDTLLISSKPREYIQSIVLSMGNSKDDLHTEVPLVQVYRHH